MHLERCADLNCRSEGCGFESRRPRHSTRCRFASPRSWQATQLGRRFLEFEGGTESKGSLEWFVYILKMKDGRLYTGISSDPESRFARHRAGDGSRTTKARGAAKVIYTEVLDSRASAARRERQNQALDSCQETGAGQRGSCGIETAVTLTIKTKPVKAPGADILACRMRHIRKN